jgi:hypothetical protein
MSRRHVLLLVACAVLAGPAAAHQAPNSWLKLDFGALEIAAEMMVPSSELVYAMNGEPTVATLPAYLLKHVGATTARGAAWTVVVTGVRATTYLDLPYFIATLRLVPPAGASTRDFLVTADAVTHEVRNHVIFVVATRDYADAALESRPEILGVLQYPARQLAIRRPVSAADRRQARAPAR